MGVITKGQNQESQLEPYQDPPEDLMTQRVCSGAQKCSFAFLPSSQVLMLHVQGPHFEDHWMRAFVFLQRLLASKAVRKFPQSPYSLLLGRSVRESRSKKDLSPAGDNSDTWWLIGARDGFRLTNRTSYPHRACEGPCRHLYFTNEETEAQGQRASTGPGSVHSPLGCAGWS